MSRALVLLLVVLVLVASGGAAVVVAAKLTEEQRKVRRELRAAAARHGLVPDYLDAIGYVESRWRLGLVNRSGADGARGGSWGPTQISEKTARAHGFTGSMQTLADDAWLSAEWTGVILAAHNRRRRLSTLADYVAAWNAGRDDADKNDDGELEEMPAGHLTRADYLPKARVALEKVQATPVA